MIASEKMRILIENAKAIVTMNDNGDVLYGQNLLIEDNYISYIGPEFKEADRVIDGRTLYVYPGLVNTHHHLFQTFTRNIPDVQYLELFPWLDYLYEVWRHMDDDIVYKSALTGISELVKYGCTTVFDHHYLHRSDIECKFVDQQFKAASEIGVRFHSSRGGMDLGVDDGGLPPMGAVQPTEDILKDSERVIKKFHDTSKYSMKQVVLAPCAPFNVTRELMVKSAELARKYGVRLHTHLCETLDEEDYCLEHFGKRPLAYMEELGWVGEDVWFAHGIHFNDDELKQLADTKTGVAHNPCSNQKLSSGTARISEMVKLGVPVGLAVDGSASNDNSNLLSELRAGYLMQRAKYSNECLSSKEMLRVATRGGAEILGRDDIGYLAKGMAADMFMIDTERVQYIGALHDPEGLLTTVGVNHPVDYTIINGRVVVEDGKLLTIDENELIRIANEASDDFISRSSNYRFNK